MKKAKNIAIFIILLILAYKVFFEGPTVIGTETTITAITEKKENTTPDDVETVYLKGDTKYIKGDTEYIKGEIVYVDSSEVNSIKTKKWTYIDSLANGVLKSEIIADNIYSRKINLTTYNKETTTTVVKNLLFLEAQIELFREGRVRTLSVGLDYINKDKWKFGLGFGYDLMIKEPFVQFSFGIPINTKKTWH